MTRLQLWRLLRDCRLHHLGFTLYEADIAIGTRAASRILGQGGSPLHFESTRVGSVTRVLMVQIQRFSESFEGARSDGML